MSAQNVWNCICAYNSDSADNIQVKYKYDLTAILKVLTSYPGVDKYHGHMSGSGGDGEHPGAADNRSNAIAYLLEHVPSEDQSDAKGPKDNSVGKAKAKANRATQATLLGLIAKAKDGNFQMTMDALTEKLDEEDKDWKSYKHVSQEYGRYREDRKKFKSGAKH